MKIRQDIANTAQFVQEQSWRVGTILYGHPIVHDGLEIECGRTVIIIGIGNENVLAITQLDGREKWEREHLIGFNSRDWEIRRFPS